MKRKRDEQNNEGKWLTILLAIFLMASIAGIIGTLAGKSDESIEPAIVQHQHEIVLRVVTEQVSVSADESDFCSAEDCWWKLPASIVFMLVGVLGGLILIVDKVSRH